MIHGVARACGPGSGLGASRLRFVRARHGVPKGVPWHARTIWGGSAALGHGRDGHATKDDGHATLSDPCWYLAAGL